MKRFTAAGLLGISITALCSPAQAETARDVLVNAAFGTTNKTTALAQINQAIAIAESSLKRNPQDSNTRLQRALAISYRGKLNRSRSDVLAARREFEALVAADPRNPETHLALAGWHLASVIELGPFMARTALGARTAVGTKEMAQALALGRNRASVSALASLQQIQVNPDDVAGARRLAEAAVGARAETSFDRVMQRQAGTLLASLRKGDGKASASLAKQLMPFGRIA